MVAFINVGLDLRTQRPLTGGEAANSVVGAGGRVGITPAMRRCLGAFQTVRTTPNAYGQKFNLLGSLWHRVPEDGRSVDRHDRRRRRVAHLVFTTPGTRLFYVKLPADRATSPAVDGGLALVAASARLAVAARRCRR